MVDDVGNRIDVTDDRVDKQFTVDVLGNVVLVPQVKSAEGGETQSTYIGHVDQNLHESSHLLFHLGVPLPLTYP